MKEFLEMLKEGDNLSDGVGQRAKEITHFEEKYASFVNLIANVDGYSSNKRRYLMKEAETTSDFPTLFGTVLERTLRAKYSIVKPDWRQYIKVGTQNDFRTAWDMATYGNRNVLAVVKERGEYKNSTLADGKFTINLQKYGRKFGLSWEAVINDDLGAFSDIASDLSLSAINSEAKYATGLFASSTGPNATLYQVGGTHPIDGTTFTNKVASGSGTTVAAIAADIATAITALKSQKDFDGNPIMFDRFIIVAPVALEFKMLNVLSSALLIATALTTSSSTVAPVGTTSENILAK
jgi:hypothetical protein